MRIAFYINTDTTGTASSEKKKEANDRDTFPLSHLPPALQPLSHTCLHIHPLFTLAFHSCSHLTHSCHFFASTSSPARYSCLHFANTFNQQPSSSLSNKHSCHAQPPPSTLILNTSPSSPSTSPRHKQTSSYPLSLLILSSKHTPTCQRSFRTEAF